MTITATTYLETEYGTFAVRFASHLNRTYQVEYSDSLSPVNWRPVGDPMAGTGGTIEVLDEEAPLPAQRFYRVVLLPP